MQLVDNTDITAGYVNNGLGRLTKFYHTTPVEDLPSQIAAFYNNTGPAKIYIPRPNFVAITVPATSQHAESICIVNTDRHSTASTHHDSRNREHTVELSPTDTLKLVHPGYKIHLSSTIDNAQGLSIDRPILIDLNYSPKKSFDLRRFYVAITRSRDVNLIRLAPLLNRTGIERLCAHVKDPAFIQWEQSYDKAGVYFQPPPTPVAPDVLFTF